MQSDGTRRMKRKSRSNSSEDLRSALLKQEFSEAWSHYRHIENARSAYFAFAVTAIGGVLAFVASLIKGGSDMDEHYAVLVAALLLLDFLLAFIYATARKQRAVLWHYENVMLEVRRLAYGESFSELDRLINVRRHVDPIVHSAAFSAQRAMETALVLTQAALGTILGWTIFAWSPYVKPMLIVLWPCFLVLLWVQLRMLLVSVRAARQVRRK
jgi:hypothetical protein